MPTLLEKNASQLDELVAIVRDIQEKASNEDRELSDIEKDRISALSEAASKLRAECEFLNDQVTSERAWSSLRQKIEANKATEDPPKRSTMPSAGGSLDVRAAWGDAFIDSEAFKNYHGGGTSQRVAVSLDMERRAAIDTSTVPLPAYVYSPATYTYATPLLDKVGKVTTSGNGVSWVQWTPNPQAAATIVAEGELKPEAAMTATPMTGSLATYAHWKAITRQALEDQPQIRSLVENRLRQGIFVALEGAVAAALVAATLPPVTGGIHAGQHQDRDRYGAGCWLRLA
jgi:HK97 family phage major capsid protein